MQGTSAMNMRTTANKSRILIVAGNSAIHDALHSALSADQLGPEEFNLDCAQDAQQSLALVRQSLQALQPYALAFLSAPPAAAWREADAAAQIWAIDPRIQIVLCADHPHTPSAAPFETPPPRDGRWLITQTPLDPTAVIQLARVLTDKWHLHRLADLPERPVNSATDAADSPATANSPQINEQDLLRTLLDNAPDHIYFKDTQSRFIKASSAQARQFGISSPAALTGKTDFDFFSDEHARPAYEDEQEILRTGQPMIGKVEKETWKDGRPESWKLTTKMPLRDNAGAIIGTFGISKDITALKQTEAALAYHRDLLATLMENSPDSIFFKDLESRLVKISRSEVDNLLRLSVSRHRAANPHQDDTALPLHLSSVAAFENYVIGKTDADMYGSDRAGEFCRDEEEIIRTGKPIVEKSERTVHPDGRIVWYLTTKGPWRDRAGQLIGTFGTSKNISELKEAERRIEEVQAQLLTAARLAGMAEIATNVLHNVGNVLNSVNVSADLMGTQLRASKLKGLARAIDLMDTHASDLGEFLTQDSKGKVLPGYLRELARALAAEHEALATELGALSNCVDHIKQVIATQQSYAGTPRVIEPAKVDELLDDALRMNANALTRHKVEVVKNYGALPSLLLDRHRVLQVLVNLISNAKQALDSIADRRTLITLQAVLIDGPALRITVTDNGEGIAPENLTRVFSHGFTTRKNGHGFGLHSCVLAAQEMGGSLQAHSDGPGKGASFILEIPAEVSAESAH
ncbi:PAS domain-containing protein [Roseateles sp.]|uniref:PAS domain-containing protein n=1 Tax=Roseateles sp. TaxID=1971397 RepID=UPI00326799EF